MGSGKKVVQMEFDFSVVRARPRVLKVFSRKKAGKPCLSCGGEVKAWSIFKRICAHCKRDPEWRGAAKGLSNIYSIDFKSSKKGRS